jgi:parallel beta-helix repeat protein
MIRRIAFALSLGLGLALGLLWLLGSQDSVALADPGILYVAPGGDCGGATPCYATVQAAVDAAIAGDVIKVAQGTYTGVQNVPSLNTATFSATQIVAVTKSVTIRGGYTTTNWTTPYPITQPTTLDAQGQGRGLYIIGDISPTIEGLRITGGDATGLGGGWLGADAGGGVYVVTATATIQSNHVFSNAAKWAGGLYVYYSDSTLNANTVSTNTASSNGGGLWLYFSSATLNSNTVSGNTAGSYGGGLSVSASNATLNGNTVSGNTAGNDGGGMSADWNTTLTLSSNIISSNTAFRGGGLELYESDATLNGNIVSGNNATYAGGGLSMRDSAPTLINTVVADNIVHRATGLGAGIYALQSSARLLHTTIARNGGGDGSGLCTRYLRSPSTVAMTDTIIVSHTVGITVEAGNTVIVNATLWHANTTNWDGAGTINHANDHSGDPTFAPDGYHLQAGSMAIDRGVSAGVTTDIDGEVRPQGGGFDIGADEFTAPPANVVWDKSVRINDGPVQSWERGPFGVGVGDSVTIVDRVRVTSTVNVSFTLSEAWSPSLQWEGYQASEGSVSTTQDSATWSATGALPNTVHVLTKTFRVVASPDYSDTLTETLVVADAVLQLPERVVIIKHVHPQLDWEKTVRINGGLLQPWDSGPFAVSPGDAVTVVDRVGITHTADVPFTVAQAWGPGLSLDEWSNDGGTVTPGDDVLTWEGIGGAGRGWQTLTTTWQVAGTTWLYESATETLTAEGVSPPPQPQTVRLLNLRGPSSCTVHINDDPTTYPTIQSAVNAAQPGDLVKVAGYCTDIGHSSGLAQVLYLDKTLTIRGGYTTTNWTAPDPAANPTTLDAQGQSRVVYIIGEIAPTIEGLRITGGRMAGVAADPRHDSGGGVYVDGAAATFSNNHVFSNTARVGGGLFLEGSDATLNGNSISANSASSHGGGVALSRSPATLDGNNISGNQGSWGGGVYLSSSNATLTGNTITGNIGSDGGGVDVRYSDATLTGNTISGNTGHDGGGLHVTESDATLTNNIVSGNSAYIGGGLTVSHGDATLSGTVVTGNSATRGGGVFLWDTASVFTNTAVAYNQATENGAGIRVDCASAPRLVHTTVSHNSGGDGSGVYIAATACDYSTVAMTNTIIASHTVGIAVTAGNAATLNATLWHANGTDTGGTGSISTLNDHTGDPAFAADGYHLTLSSAAIDKGVDAGVTTDIDGDTRPWGAGYDIGADELRQRYVYLPLVLRRW